MRALILVFACVAGHVDSRSVAQSSFERGETDESELLTRILLAPNPAALSNRLSQRQQPMGQKTQKLAGDTADQRSHAAARRTGDSVMLTQGTYYFLFLALLFSISVGTWNLFVALKLI
mmetsp:Transcript_27115/g.42129  ORF Transcript_27115/g.42129 Transcript_27115/m.42129 type:complete len:119 (-) Transcript_27115:42-398(-)|eukprot:CAMPEP_0169257156 /NCGR_PEP_ID=MMETSP1016-20121227/40675_1 /TAXON_ID=342587 /ORGANISM="Karlodinium micrum, Strain CCMP2283" /LENGTH=118 /DNA_ID=CAMNT_0009338899 /DNA_START=69 /DNA_END=425 /DNA_ORIENTATION=-